MLRRSLLVSPNRLLVRVYVPSADDHRMISDVPLDTGQGPLRLPVHNLLIGSDDIDLLCLSSMSVNAGKTLRIDDPGDTLFRQARGPSNRM